GFQPDIHTLLARTGHSGLRGFLCAPPEAAAPGRAWRRSLPARCRGASMGSSERARRGRGAPMARVGGDVVIRAAPSDAPAALLDLKRARGRGTGYMMYEPGGRQADADAVAREREEIVAARNSVVLVADAGDELAGYFEARGGEFRRVRHVATVIAGVRQCYAGQGLGTRLFQALLEWAEDAGLTRL